MVAVATLAGCGRKPDTTPPSFTAACADDTGCIAPFTCIGGQRSPHSCTEACATDADCPKYHWSPPCAPDVDIDVQATCYDGICHGFIACDSSVVEAGADGN
ncbi:MAG TPA: hypothetical protein VIK30_12685 [Polyangia bacterium]